MANSRDPLALVENNPNYKPDSEEKAISYNFQTLPAYIWSANDVKSGRETVKYDTLSRNPVYRTALLTLIAGIFWPATMLQARNDYKKYPEFEVIDNYIIEFIDKQLSELQNESWHNILKGLTEAGMTYGFCVAEMVWENEAPNRKLTNIKLKPSYNFDAYTDKNDVIENLYYAPFGIYLDPRGFVFKTWPRYVNGNPYGESELMSIQHDVKLLEIFEEKRAKAAQLLLVKPIIHYYIGEGRSAKEKQTALTAVQALESGSVAQFPMKLNENGEPVKFDLIEVIEDRASKDAILDVGAVILQHEKRITRSVGIPDELGQTTVSVGSYAKAKETFNMFVSKVQQGQEWLCDLVNSQIINPIIKYNFENLPEDYKCPVWKFEETEEEFKMALMEYYNMGIGSGIFSSSEPFIREKLGEPARPEPSMNPIQTDGGQQNVTRQS